MNQPWGIGGPQFLGLYAVSIVVSVVVTCVLRTMLRGGRETDAVADVYTLAVVCGGPEHVVDTAVHALIEGGRLRASRDHSITVCAEVPPDEPVQRAVLAELTRVRTTNLRGARRLARHTKPIRQIERAAREHGLLLSRGRAAAVRWGALLPPFAVFCVGVARLVNGLRLHRPTGFLTMMLVATVVVLLILVTMTPRSSRAGAALLARARGRTVSEPPLVGTYGSTGALVPAAVLGVAALGPAGVTDPTLRQALYGGMTSSYSGGGGGSSCGSGGGCGGGGGGCGGGGCGGGCGG